MNSSWTQNYSSNDRNLRFTVPAITITTPNSLIFSVVTNFYDTDVNKEYAIRGNAAILKCQIPSFVADFVSVVSWHTSQNENFYPGAPDGTIIDYKSLFFSCPTILSDGSQQRIRHSWKCGCFEMFHTFVCGGFCAGFELGRY